MCPVQVRRLKLPCHTDGDCELRDNKFRIRVQRSLPEHEAIETLLHEWGHVLAWDKGKDPHGDEWGKAYSKVYRLFLKEIIEASEETDETDSSTARRQHVRKIHRPCP